MGCPRCGLEMSDVTESWHTFAEAEGATYLTSYVTIMHCPGCGTVAGMSDDGMEWVLEPEAPATEE